MWKEESPCQEVGRGPLMELSVVDDGIVQIPKPSCYKVGNDHINLRMRCIYLGELLGVRSPQKWSVNASYRVMTASNEQRGDPSNGTKPQNPMQRPESPVHCNQCHLTSLIDEVE